MRFHGAFFSIWLEIILLILDEYICALRGKLFLAIFLRSENAGFPAANSVLFPMLDIGQERQDDCGVAFFNLSIDFFVCLGAQNKPYGKYMDFL
jgi:hypothetical protein